jgi:hypothetical protein
MKGGPVLDPERDSERLGLVDPKVLRIARQSLDS